MKDSVTAEGGNYSNAGLSINPRDPALRNVTSHCCESQNGRPSVSRCTQQGEMRNTQMRIKLKITVFNKDKAGQGRADTQEHRGVTSRPDDTKLNRQELIYTG